LSNALVSFSFCQDSSSALHTLDWIQDGMWLSSLWQGLGVFGLRTYLVFCFLQYSLPIGGFQLPAKFLT
jgi:hypothetical protein